MPIVRLIAQIHTSFDKTRYRAPWEVPCLPNGGV